MPPIASRTTVPPGKRVYFLSDLHLGAHSFADPKKAEHNVVEFLDSISSDASEIYFLGDVLDYWFEYRYVVPRGHIRFFGKLAQLTDAGVKITWIIGNHDIWIFDYLPEELGVEVADGSIIRKIGNRIFFLSHGDGVGKTPVSFQAMRNLFRNRICQKLYSAIHPRWTIPFALGWSRKSRRQGMELNKCITVEAIKKLQEFAAADHSAHPEIDFYIFGHVHAQSRKMVDKAEVITLGGWVDVFDYLVFDGDNIRSCIWKGA